MGATLNDREIALLAQKVENFVVGAPCGVMDQMTSALGPPRSPARARLPARGGDRAVAGPRRHRVRRRRLGDSSRGLRRGLRNGPRRGVHGLPHDHRRRGRRGPAAVSGARRDRRCAVQGIPRQRPRRRLARPLSRADPRTDAGTRVPRALRREPPTRPRRSIRRAAIPCGPRPSTRSRSTSASTSFARCSPTSGACDEQTRVRLGELMYASHASYSACGLGSDGTDQLVALVREAGPSARALRREDHGRRKRWHGRGPGRARQATHRRPDRRSLRTRVGSRVGGVRRIVRWVEGIRRAHVDVRRPVPELSNGGHVRR